MRFIHTAAWHPGRIFHSIHLTEDQSVVLDQLLEVIRETKAEALHVSGDIYDRPVPPADAVRLLDDSLSRVVLGLKAPVLLIDGNHESPDRLVGIISHAPELKERIDVRLEITPERHGNTARFSP